MTTSAFNQATSDLWSFDLSEMLFPRSQAGADIPRSTQDSELLQQIGFIPGLKEILMLRQVHALEHATVWVLSGRATPPERARSSRSPSDNELLGGISTDQGFYLYGQVAAAELRQAVQEALRRITSGEWDLAVHPRCGTNLSVGMLLTVGLALGVHLLLPKGPIEQIVGLGVAATTATQLAPDLGGAAQRYITTAIPFNLAVTEVLTATDYWGRPAHFVQVQWVE